MMSWLILGSFFYVTTLTLAYSLWFRRRYVLNYLKALNDQVTLLNAGLEKAVALTQQLVEIQKQVVSGPITGLDVKLDEATPPATGG